MDAGMFKKMNDSLLEKIRKDN